MSEASVWRRCAVVSVALAVSAMLFRAQIADALVVRGDEMLYRGQTARALSFYARAASVDANSATAIDRWLFVSSTARRAGAMRAAIAASQGYLRSHPHDYALRFDRAMTLRALGRSAQAEQEFARLGRETADPRSWTFAGAAAQKLGQFTRARRFYKAALAVAPGFYPAIRALANAERRS